MLVLSTILVYDRQVQELPLVKNPVISHERGQLWLQETSEKAEGTIHIHRRHCDYKKRQRKLKGQSTFTGDTGHKKRQRKLKRQSTFTGDTGRRYTKKTQTKQKTEHKKT